jgi:hypothetical protein
VKHLAALDNRSVAAHRTLPTPSGQPTDDGAFFRRAHFTRMFSRRSCAVQSLERPPVLHHGATIACKPPLRQSVRDVLCFSTVSRSSASQICWHEAQAFRGRRTGTTATSTPTTPLPPLPPHPHHRHHCHLHHTTTATTPPPPLPHHQHHCHRHHHTTATADPPPHTHTHTQIFINYSSEGMGDACCCERCDP